MKSTVPEEPDSQMQAFIESWSASLSLVLGQISGSDVSCQTHTASPEQTPAEASSDVWLVAAASGPFSGELALRVASRAARKLARTLMAEPLDESEEMTAEYTEALQELSRQVSGHVVTTLKSRWSDLQLRIEVGPTPTWSSGDISWLSCGEPLNIILEMRLSAALTAALRAPQQKLEQPVQKPSEKTDQKLNMLLDVELAVSLRFGSRRMLLKEVLDLCAGSIVELDQQLPDPVDLLLDGKVIARGEVVVVDGNYGLRVTHLAGANPAN